VKKKKILIFGGSGFLASHLCDELNKRKYQVKIFDFKKSPFLKNGQKIILGDILDSKKVINACKGVDIIYHFAAVADLREANEKHLKAIKTNIFGTVNILEGAVKNNVKKIIFASSIYARSQQGGFYSTTKLSSEMIIERYCEKYPLKFIILRFGSLYGVRSNYFNPIRNFILQAIKKKKIVRFSDGKEIRNYIHVNDLKKICLDVLEKKFENKHINILGTKATSVRNIIFIIKKIIPNIKIIFKNKKMIYNYKKNPFTYKIRKGITLRPKKEYNIRLGIKDLIEQIKKKSR
tara:strand:- start:18 stop:893 length:876 start_codon:yes stop_codon:yes gene_type:complete